MSVCIGHSPTQAAHTDPLPYKVCGDPESGTDHFLNKVSACLIWHRVHKGASRVNVTSFSEL